MSGTGFLRDDDKESSPRDGRNTQRSRRQTATSTWVQRLCGGWAAAFFCAALLVVGAPRAQAGVNVWTTHGPWRGSVRVLAIDPQTPSTLYAGTDNSGVFKTTDGGGSWTVVNTGLTNLAVDALAINPQSPTTLYAVSDGGGVFKSTDSGASCVPQCAGKAAGADDGCGSTCPPDVTPPTVPPGLVAVPISCNQIRLTWEPSTDGDGSGVRGYKLYMPSEGAGFVEVPAPTTSFTVGWLAATTMYSYAISAIDNAGNESARSVAVTATTLDPACGCQPSCSPTATPTTTLTPTPSVTGTATPTPPATASPTGTPQPGGGGGGCTVTPTDSGAAWWLLVPPMGLWWAQRRGVTGVPEGGKG